MKILLTHGYFLNEDPREQAIMKPYPPLGLLYISAYLEENGFDNDVFDTTFSRFESLKNYLDEHQPGLIGIYTNLMTKLNVLKIVEYVRNTPSLRHCRIVLGGPEVRHHAANFLAAGADVVAFGEGEQTMLELSRFYTENPAGPPAEIPGIAWLDADADPVFNPERGLMKELDELPMPNRKKIDLQRYFDAWRGRHGYAMVSVSTMRGCPYACKWCSRAVYGKSYRRRSPAKVVEELEYLRSHYDFDNIWFVDDVFTINHRWMRDFADRMAEKDWVIPYEVITRADRMNEEIVGLLKQTGCFRVWIGAESGSQTVLDAMKRMVRIEKVTEMVRLTKQHGMETGNFIMLGYPGEKEADIRRTLHFLKAAEPDHFTLTVAYPIKGTEMYAETEGEFLTSHPWETSTDRDIDFKRPYSRRYYQHAMNWIQREMAARSLSGFSALKTRVRAWSARLGMLRERAFAPMLNRSKA
ncbi:MAG TPA: radical SAM protein [Flavilitoribacter sp.]|nr:radical SAM protein [Flavilitoribacter sp.]HMQ87723.1 radical SAM protein [Flavilitoribacter sp.]